MKKILLILLIIVGLGVVGFLVLDRNKSGSTATNTESSSNANSSASPESEPSSSIAGGTVDIKNMAFTPPQISVQKGAKVTWTNNDTVAHTVTDDLSDVGGPDSGEIAPGASYSFTFQKAGSFQYHCTIHPYMRGTIVVK